MVNGIVMVNPPNCPWCNGTGQVSDATLGKWETFKNNQGAVILGRE